MTTKAQERKALEQIRKIVEGLGEDSYIGMAFEGCFGIAEDNINNDWGCSMKQRAESAEKEVLRVRQELAEVKNEANENTEDAQEWRKRYESMLEAKNTLKDDYIKTWNAYCEEQKKVTELEQQVIELKAKLYDMIVAAQ